MEENKYIPVNGLFKLNKYLKTFFHELTDLKEGVDKLGTIGEIKDMISMSGANAWMLMCSIVIASIGLDLNSPAVIIGAMLISPLMAPILGIGMAIGINDKNTLKKSIAHFGVAIVIALLTSFIYFYVSPLSTITPEIEARTEPTFLDILIAFFGGIAGIISYARKDISTTLPGVAIATALMPPLCVTGFGLANFNMEIASSSFYLFFLNTSFVSLATFIIIRFLKFPYRDYPNLMERRRNMAFIVIFAFINIVPSVFIFKNVINRVDDQLKVEKFLKETIGEDRKFVDDYRLTYTDTVNLLVMKVYGDSISYAKMDQYSEGLKSAGLENTKLEIISTSEITMDQILHLENQINGMEQLASRLTIVQKEKKEGEEMNNALQVELSKMKLDSTLFAQVSNEIRSFDDQIGQITYASSQVNNFETYQEFIPYVIIDWVTEKKQKDLEQRINKFLKVRLQKDSIRVIHVYQ